MEREHALEIVRACHEEVGGEDLANDGAHVRERSRGRPLSLDLQEGVRHAGKCLSEKKWVERATGIEPV
jgi:hypothetical protein